MQVRIKARTILHLQSTCCNCVLMLDTNIKTSIPKFASESIMCRHCPVTQIPAAQDEDGRFGFIIVSRNTETAHM